MDFHTGRDEGGQVRTFFVLVGACTLPFWVLGAISDATLTSQLSIASLMIVAPFVAAIALTARSAGRSGVLALLSRAVDPRLRGGIVWYVPALALMPVAVVFEVGFLRAFGVAVPPFDVTAGALFVDLILFWVAATLEEVGWTGYATDRLRSSHSVLATAVIIGVVWALWHVPAMLAMPSEPSWTFIALQCGVLVAMRIVMVWVYEGSGRSLFAVIALHAVSNVSMMTLFPVYGSHYDPLAAFVVLGTVALVVAALSAIRRRRSSWSGQRALQVPDPRVP